MKLTPGSYAAAAAGAAAGSAVQRRNDDPGHVAVDVRRRRRLHPRPPTFLEGAEEKADDVIETRRQERRITGQR